MPKPFPKEFREDVIRVFKDSDSSVAQVAKDFGISEGSLANWMKQADIDGGKRPGPTTEQQRRITELERENRELRRANEILKAASTFFRAGARPATAEVVKFIGVHHERWGVEPICRSLQDAPSTYYAAVSRQPPVRSQRDE